MNNKLCLSSKSNLQRLCSKQMYQCGNSLHTLLTQILCRAVSRRKDLHHLHRHDLQEAQVSVAAWSRWWDRQLSQGMMTYLWKGKMYIPDIMEQLQLGTETLNSFSLLQHREIVMCHTLLIWESLLNESNMLRFHLWIVNNMRLFLQEGLHKIKRKLVNLMY